MQSHMQGTNKKKISFIVQIEKNPYARVPSIAAQTWQDKQGTVTC